MELWIRSQDKDLLIAVYGISLFQKTIFASNKECKEFILGTYSTEKRVLEVLDEIQRHIQKQGKMEIDNDIGLKYYGNVYEMPEE